MIDTHILRPRRELGGLWDFTPLQGDASGKTFKVPVPSCWETYPGFEGYRGEALYETSFSAGGNIRLEFKGVSHTAAVFLDGKEIGSHYNAYTPFSIVVKGLAQGEHRLAVRADNRFSENSALHFPNDYMSYGGISRPVVLENLGDAFIKSARFTPLKGEDGWKGRLEAVLCNMDDKPHTVSLCAQAAGTGQSFGELRLEGGEEISFEADMSFDGVEPWAPENPRLYELKCVLSEDGRAIDDLIDRIGFRTVEARGRDILLNGRPLRIKGVCRHEDHPHYGCALPFSAIAYDLGMIRELGANAVRTTHYPNDELFLDLCDELGILVWEENHARALDEERMRNPNFRRQCRDCNEEMVSAHYNHPSIIIWGILNECASDTEYGRECYSEQLMQLRSLDSSRPLSFATYKNDTDICLDLPDIVSFNQYPGWYHDTKATEHIAKLYDWIQADTGGAGKPFLITEIGAGAIYGCRSPSLEKWSEEFQAKLLGEQIAAVLSRSGCSGLFLWQFCDVRVSREWFFARPRSMNNKGIVDEYRRRKLGYDVVKEAYMSYGDYMD